MGIDTRAPGAGSEGWLGRSGGTLEARCRTGIDGGGVEGRTAGRAPGPPVSASIFRTRPARSIGRKKKAAASRASASSASRIVPSPFPKKMKSIDPEPGALRSLPSSDIAKSVIDVDEHDCSASARPSARRGATSVRRRRRSPPTEACRRRARSSADWSADETRRASEAVAPTYLRAWSRRPSSPPGPIIRSACREPRHRRGDSCRLRSTPSRSWGEDLPRRSARKRRLRVQFRRE